MTWFGAMYMELRSYFNEQFSVYFAYFPVCRFLCVWSWKQKVQFYHRVSVVTKCARWAQIQMQMQLLKRKQNWMETTGEWKTKKNQNKTRPLRPLDRPICCVKHHVLATWTLTESEESEASFQLCAAQLLFIEANDVHIVWSQFYSKFVSFHIGRPWPAWLQPIGY